MGTGRLERTILPGTVAALVALCPAGLAGQASGQYRLGGESVAVYNVAGLVEIRGGTGQDVAIDVRAGGTDAAELTVETGPIGGDQPLRVLYPADRIVYGELGRGSRTTIRVREDGTFFDDRGRRRGDEVTIAGSGRGLEAHADLTISVPPGKTVGVYLGVGEVTATNVDGDLLIEVASAPVTTSATRGALTVDTGSGRVEVRDAEGDVLVDTGSGRVAVDGMRGDRLRVDTGSGSVAGSDIEVADLNIDTGSGAITLRDVGATDGVLDTGSGSVRLELLADVNDLRIDTGSGSVTVVFPADLGAQLELESGSGGIELDVPIQVTRFERSALRGEIGDGRGTIRVDTGSGSIRFIQR